jgi:hypothetical protein
MERKTKASNNSRSQSSSGNSQPTDMQTDTNMQGYDPTNVSDGSAFRNPNPTMGYRLNNEDKIRERAYQLYLQNGHASDSQIENWLQAEREINDENR